MNTHDTLAFAVASEAVRQIRAGGREWCALFSAEAFATSSRAWPVPDFVIADPKNATTIAGEFKPPDQTKREYLTGLGQAVAYTHDFHYGILVVPDVANDGFRIADHIHGVLNQDIMNDVPVGLLCYEAGRLSAANASFRVLRSLKRRAAAPVKLAPFDSSFWAKWREQSPMELGRYLEYLYDEGLPRNSVRPGTIRDRAFNRLWEDIQKGEVRHWGGGVRHARAGLDRWRKNYTHFVAHIGWIETGGRLTDEGLSALRIVHRYGDDSQLFLDELARAILVTGKHLVLINAINEFQNSFQDEHGAFRSPGEHLRDVEASLEKGGFLKRNPERRLAAIKHSERDFLKSEKQLWGRLRLTVPYGPKGGRAYHPSRGLVFNWSRITSLLT